MNDKQKIYIESIFSIQRKISSTNARQTKFQMTNRDRYNLSKWKKSPSNDRNILHQRFYSVNTGATHTLPEKVLMFMRTADIDENNDASFDDKDWREINEEYFFLIILRIYQWCRTRLCRSFLIAQKTREEERLQSSCCTSSTYINERTLLILLASTIYLWLVDSLL